MVDEAEAKRKRKAEKRAAKEAIAAAAAAAEERDVDEEEVKRQRKASKKLAKEAASAAAEAEEEVDEVEARRQRKAAKRAAKVAAAAQEEEAEEAPKKAKKEKRVAEPEEAEEPPKAKKSNHVAEQADEVATPGQEAKVFRVFIKGLPYSVEEASLRSDFTECGEITKLQLPMDNGKPKGFAFISFASQQGFDAALKYDNTDYGGRYINVSEANPDGKGSDGKGKSGRAGDWNCPKCDDLVFARNNACRKCGAERPGGPVAMDAKGKGAGKAGDWNCPKCGDLVFARNNACRSCGAERPGGPVSDGRDHENTVFIRGLPWSATEEGVRKDFADCGEMESMRMPMTGDGRPAGIAFIKFATSEGVTAAMKFDETEYGGRTINVVKSGDVVPKGKGKGKGKDKGKDGNGKGKDGKDGKGKGKGKAPTASFAKYSGCIVASTAEVKTFEDSDGD